MLDHVEELRLRAVVTDADGNRSLHLDGPPDRVVRLTEGDVRLLELAFETHCPACEEY
ncbi:hypothetical protein ACO229_06910 [Promicromonospora sp. MS192]|uniref:hypothetical protein n=1 Tax=Promicromonospora sp. MS192 TaxID=3412684 RepID=UPI003C2F24C9